MTKTNVNCHGNSINSKEHTETESSSRSICLLTHAQETHLPRATKHALVKHTAHIWPQIYLQKSRTNRQFYKATGNKYSPILLTLPAASVTDLSPIDIPFLQLTVQPTGVRHISCVVSLGNNEGDCRAVSLVNSVCSNLAIVRVNRTTTRGEIFVIKCGLEISFDKNYFVFLI